MARRASILIPALAAALLLLSCTKEESERYLAFFFDGVVDKDSAQSVVQDSIPSAFRRGGEQAETKPVETLYYHEPYRQRDCSSCHDMSAGTRLNEEQPGLCFMCHEDFREQYTVLHGPVAGGYCTACHEHHLAKNEKLLSRTGRDLCQYCHRTDDVMRNPVHEGTEEMDCADCHGAHGGDDRTMIL